MIPYLNSPAIAADEASCPIAATVLLGGSVRPTPFSTAIQRSLLDLPVARGRSLLGQWRQHVAALPSPLPAAPSLTPASQVPPSALPSPPSPPRLLRVLTDQAATGPSVFALSSDVTVQIDRDPTAWRGTAGLLRDIATAYAADDYILVANAGQILVRPLPELFARLAALHADVAMIAHQDGTPVTLMLIRCDCLSELPRVGYFDMKEQALPLIGMRHAVKVVTFDAPVCCGIRTAETYIAALRTFHRARMPHGVLQNSNPTTEDTEAQYGVDGVSSVVSVRSVVGFEKVVKSMTGSQSLAEDWKSDFGIQEDGAIVDPTAKLHNSVVLRGATVGRHAVLVRSVACPGAVVAPGSVVVDKLVSADGVQNSREAA